MDRTNHYEAAFEAYLQEQGLGYIAVDETRRSVFGATPLKSLDFIVHTPDGVHLLIDVKGRRYPAGPPEKPRRIWECWSTRDDLVALEQWGRLFGPEYEGMLLFMYDVTAPEVCLDDQEDVWIWRERRYLLRAIPAEVYGMHMRVRSPRWNTVDLPGPLFRRLVQPFSYFVRRTVPAQAGGEDWWGNDEG